MQKMSSGILREVDPAREVYKKIYAEWNSKNRNLEKIGQMLRQLKV